MTWLRRLMMDVSPLRESPPYRRLWIGSGLSSIGGQMTNYAVILQVFILTRSSLSVGLVGLAIAVPAIAVALLGGALVDATDRRKTVLFATTAQAAVSGVLALQAFSHLGEVWLLYLLVGVQSVVGAINAPARRTFMPSLLRRDQLAAGAALQTLTGHASVMIGPALAGVITASFGLKTCYLIDAISFAFSLYGVARLPPMRVRSRSSMSGVQAVFEGLRFVIATRVILGAFLADMSATFFGMPMALFPVINAERFGGHPETLGLLASAVALGGVLGSGLSGPVSRLSRQGVGMLVAGGVWGIGLLGFGLSDSFLLGLVALVVAGAADVSAVVLRTALVQSVTPDELRGRVSSAEFAVGAGVPQLGNFRAGVVGSLSSPTIGVVSGALATIVGAVVVGMAVPSLPRFRASHEPGVSAAATGSIGGPPS
ncbi:MAG: MFS transporter [Acidimicrobiales bacterium]